MTVASPTVLPGVPGWLPLPVGAGPAELATTERTVRAGCLKAHLILTELGLVIVHQAKDNEAETYYRAVQRILKMESQKAEQLLRADPLKPAQSRPVKLAAKPRK